MSNTLRAYNGQPAFSGLYDEDLESVAENYVATADLCDATDLERRKAMFAMLHGIAHTLVSRKGRDFKTFEEGLNLLRSWYKSTDKQARLLTEWHLMSLLNSIEDQPDDSQMAVFRAFADRLMSLQHQVPKDYHTDRYLRDRLMIAIDIRDIHNALRDHTRGPHISSSTA